MLFRSHNTIKVQDGQSSYRQPLHNPLFSPTAAHNPSCISSFLSIILSRVIIYCLVKFRNLCSLKRLSCLFSGTHHSGIIITIVHFTLTGFKLTAKRKMIRNTCQEHLRALFHIIRFFIGSIFIPILGLLLIIIRKRIESSQTYTQILVRIIHR